MCLANLKLAAAFSVMAVVSIEGSAQNDKSAVSSDNATTASENSTETKNTVLCTELLQTLKQLSKQKAQLTKAEEIEEAQAQAEQVSDRLRDNCSAAKSGLSAARKDSQASNL